MREVEEEFSEHHHMAMIVGEVKAVMLAAGGVRSYQDIVEALWRVLSESLWICYLCCFVAVDDRSSVEFPCIEA